MGERYERIILSENRLWNTDSPVMLLKWALLKDNKMKHNLLQCKFENYSDKNILAVSIEIKCFDLNKELVEIVDYDYLDLNVYPEQTFGDQEAIELENRTSREFCFFIKKIFFTNDTSWDTMSELNDIGQYKSISEFGKFKNVFLENYNRQTSHEITTYYAPEFEEDHWCCACGFVNSHVKSECSKCGIKKDILENLSDKNNLESKYESEQKQKIEEQKKIEEHKKIEEQKRIEAHNTKKKKIIKALMLTSITIGCLCVIIPLSLICYRQFVKLPNTYDTAIKKMEENSFVEAVKIFDELGDYKESMTKKSKCVDRVKHQAEEKLNQYKPDEAVDILKKSNLEETDVFKDALAEQSYAQSYKRQYNWLQNIQGTYSCVADPSDRITIKGKKLMLSDDKQFPINFDKSKWDYLYAEGSLSEQGTTGYYILHNNNLEDYNHIRLSTNLTTNGTPYRKVP